MEIAKQSELLASLRAYMNVLQTVENYVHIDITRVFNNCSLQQTQALDWCHAKTNKDTPLIACTSTSVENDSSGLRYLYVTSNNYDSWKLSTRHINAADSMPAITLDPLFADHALLTIGYNDEYPNGTNIFTGGHAKGVVATDGVTGIWLIHSVPKFPTIPGYEYPSTGTMYGQSFLCLTLSSDQMDKVGEQLIFNQPNIYYSSVPQTLEGRFSNLESALARRWRNVSPYYNLLELETLEGNKFNSFAKSEKFNQDLYEDFVAPALDSNLLVEAWRKGIGNMASNCSKSDKVYNIVEIEEKKLKLSFKTTSDHSKWAVSQASGLKLWRWRIGGADWICVGDINRQEHQKLRGGGTVCQKNSKLTQIYRDMVCSYDSCPSVKPMESFY